MSETYAVFARKAEQDPLTQVGNVSVAEGRTIEEAVRESHGEEWLELVAIPEKYMAWAIREDD